MNIRNVALLIFLVCFSFQSEIYAFSSNDENEQIKEQKKIEEKSFNNIESFLISLLVLSNYMIF